MPNPSWLEIKHFVTFLNRQLDSCEQSVFCDDSLVGDVLKGLKSFVVKFMIRMSKVFYFIKKTSETVLHDTFFDKTIGSSI